MPLNPLKISLSLAVLLSATTAAQAARVPATSEGTGTGQRWTFTSGPGTLKSGPKGAGRIISLQYAGLEILHMDTNTATNYGSTFWPSPQAAWASNWPPSANIDGAGAYTATYTDTSLVLNGQTDATNNVRINKQYWANSADTSFGQKFTLVNTAATAKAWAPWQDTRVDTGGVYLFPKGTGAPTGDLAQFVKDSSGISWYRHDANNTLASGTTKFYADGSQGWFAHVKANGVVLIKKFTDTPAAKKAPGVENEIEIYSTNRPLTGTDFVEMEVQGRYDTIPAGDSITWSMKWYVRKLPESVVVAVGNPAIVTFVNQVVAGPVSVNGASRASSTPAFQLGSAGRRVSLDLAKNTDVTLSLVSSSGREISRLHSGRLTQGRHEFALSAAMPKGVYWVVLKDASRPGVVGMHKLIWLQN
jgi:hypothetical protein